MAARTGGGSGGFPVGVPIIHAASIGYMQDEIEPRKQVNVRLTNGTAARLQLFADLNGITVSALMETLAANCSWAMTTRADTPVEDWGDGPMELAWKKTVADARYIDARRRQR